MHRLLRATEHVYGYLWQKNEVIPLSNLETTAHKIWNIFETPDPKKSIERGSVGKSPKKSQKIDLEVRELISTMQIIFQTSVARNKRCMNY